MASSASMPGTVSTGQPSSLTASMIGLDLQRQVVGHRRARRLVLGVPVVAEGLALVVEDAGAVRAPGTARAAASSSRRRRGSRRSERRRGRAGRAARGRRGRGSSSRRRAAEVRSTMQPIVKEWTLHARRRPPRIDAMKSPCRRRRAPACGVRRAGRDAADVAGTPAPPAAPAVIRRAMLEDVEPTARPRRRADHQAHRHRRQPRSIEELRVRGQLHEGHRSAEGRARPSYEILTRRRRARSVRRRSRHVARRRPASASGTSCASDPCRTDGGLHRRSRSTRRQR